MNTQKLVATLVLIAATGSALADVVSPPEAVTSTKTRAEVIAELKQARDSGLLAYRDHDYPVALAFASTKTRTEVMAELKQARDSGLVTFQR